MNEYKENFTISKVFIRYNNIDDLIIKMFNITDEYVIVDRFIQVTDPTSIDLE